MSKLKVSGNASGTGVITLEAPNTNTDRTITLPDSSDTLVSTAPSTSGNILTSDGTNWTSAAPAAAGADTSLSNLSATGENKVCQAWVNFNGTGTIAIRDSFNVSSITDNGTAKYDINFSSTMANANYVVSGTCDAKDSDQYACFIGWSTANGGGDFNSLHSTSYFRINTFDMSTYITQDSPEIMINVFGD